MRSLFWATFCLAGLCLALAGCESEVSRDDLGEVMFRVPKAPGVDKPYELPELGMTVKSKSSGESSDDNPTTMRQQP